MSASVLTAVAWPYANGPRHIGHVSGIGVPSDLFARYTAAKDAADRTLAHVRASGGFPLTGLLTTDEIAQAKPWGNPSGSSSSYGGNPLGAAAPVLRRIDPIGQVFGAAHVPLLLDQIEDRELDASETTAHAGTPPQ